MKIMRLTKPQLDALQVLAQGPRSKVYRAKIRSDVAKRLESMGLIVVDDIDGSGWFLTELGESVAHVDRVTAEHGALGCL